MDDEDGIEMQPPSRERNGSGLSDQEIRSESLEWVRPSIRRQNRCFASAMIILMVAVCVLTLGGIYEKEDASYLETYDSEAGVAGETDSDNKLFLGNNNINGKQASPSDAYLLKQNYTAEAHKAALARWNRTHPGQPYPGVLGGKGHGHTTSSAMTGSSGSHNVPPSHIKQNSHGQSASLSPHSSHSAAAAQNRPHSWSHSNPGFDTRPGTQNGGDKHTVAANSHAEHNMPAGSVPFKPIHSQTETTNPGNQIDQTQNNEEDTNGDVTDSQIEPDGPLSGNDSKPDDLENPSDPPPIDEVVADSTNAEEETTDGEISVCSNLSAFDEWNAETVSLSDGVKYEIVDQFPHDPDAFTQGLTYSNGVLYESTGIYGKSSIRTLDPDTGEPTKIVGMEKEYFGEGMAFFNDQLIQITWKERKGFIYDPKTLETVRDFSYSTTTGQGWGITWDPCQQELIVTDGSSFLHFWDPESLEQTRKVRVMRQDGRQAEELNEIEFWRNRVLANVWYEDVLLVIDPSTGTVEKEYDFSELWPKSTRKQAKADVFNGISESADPDILYVTGKLWNRMYKVKLLI